MLMPLRLVDVIMSTIEADTNDPIPPEQRAKTLNEYLGLEAALIERAIEQGDTDVTRDPQSPAWAVTGYRSGQHR